MWNSIVTMLQNVDRRRKKMFCTFVRGAENRRFRRNDDAEVPGLPAAASVADAEHFVVSECTEPTWYGPGRHVVIRDTKPKFKHLRGLRGVITGMDTSNTKSTYLCCRQNDFQNLNSKSSICFQFLYFYIVKLIFIYVCNDFFVLNSHIPL